MHTSCAANTYCNWTSSTLRCNGQHNSVATTNTRLFVPFLRNVAHRSLQQLIKEEVIAVYFKCIFEDKIKRDDNNRLFWSETGICDTVLKFTGRKLV